MEADKDNGILPSTSRVRSRKKKGPLLPSNAKTSAGRPTPIGRRRIGVTAKHKKTQPNTYVPPPGSVEISEMAASSSNLTVGHSGEVYFKKKRVGKLTTSMTIKRRCQCYFVAK
jgi:hypothetical protein